LNSFAIQNRPKQRKNTDILECDPKTDPFTVRHCGLSLNARVFVPVKKRDKLEKLIRYMARGPIASERLSQISENKLCYELKSPWSNGVTHVFFTPMEFVAKLAALIPPPRVNLVRYFGCFAPNFKKRKLIVKRLMPTKPKEVEGRGDQQGQIKKQRLSRSEMLKRVFEIDVSLCPKCAGRLEQIAVIRDRSVAKQILESLGIKPLRRQNQESIMERGPPNPNSIPEEEDQRSQDW
jgi:hypothetical protein